MEIVHISAEVYPAAKAGGLGDVVGALPKYLNRLNSQASALMPAYQTEWLDNQSYDVVTKDSAPLGEDYFNYEIRYIHAKNLGFPLYTIHIPGRFDRPGIYIDPDSGYGYWDELERFTCFQIACLDWIQQWKNTPDIIHCHDHHTGLIPFMLTRCFRYESIQHIPTVLTIHNAEYHGEHDISKYQLLPPFDIDEIGLLDWEDKLNSLATGIKCAWKVTTVSQSYMEELSEESSGLENLITHEWQKTTGIVNGIDSDVWNPESDEFIEHNFVPNEVIEGKKINKQWLCDEFNLNPDLPLISFIGRLVPEKGADILPPLIRSFLEADRDVNFIVLGTGRPDLHNLFKQMNKEFLGYFDSRLEYNEKLAHQIYAGTDFIIMPSRVEPCGLNQMYAMQYGSVPIVRAIGGLKDTVKDIEQDGGYGVLFDEFSVENAIEACERSLDYYQNDSLFSDIKRKLVSLDFSWERSAGKYEQLYEKIS